MSSSRTAAAIGVVSVTAIANDFVAHKTAREAESRENQARAAASMADSRADMWERSWDELMVRGSSQVHNLRTYIKAHKQIEAELVNIIKADHPDHPIADMDVVEELVERRRDQLLFSDIELITRTYPNGKVPDGAFNIAANGKAMQRQGTPGFPWQIGQQARHEAVVAMMIALGEIGSANEFSNRPKDTPADAEALERRVIAKVAELKKVLTDDDQKGFFTSMNKKKRAAAEEALAKFEKHVEAAKWVVKNAYEAAAEAERAAAVKIRVDAKLAELERMGFGDYAIRPEPGLKG